MYGKSTFKSVLNTYLDLDCSLNIPLYCEIYTYILLIYNYDFKFGMSFWVFKYLTEDG